MDLEKINNAIEILIAIANIDEQKEYSVWIDGKEKAITPTEYAKTLAESSIDDLGDSVYGEMVMNLLPD